MYLFSGCVRSRLKDDKLVPGELDGWNEESTLPDRMTWRSKCVVPRCSTFFIFRSFVPFEVRRHASAYRAHIRTDIYCHILCACQCLDAETYFFNDYHVWRFVEVASSFRYRRYKREPRVYRLKDIQIYALYVAFNSHRSEDQDVYTL